MSSLHHYLGDDLSELERLYLRDLTAEEEVEIAAKNAAGEALVKEKAERLVQAKRLNALAATAARKAERPGEAATLDLSGLPIIDPS